VILYHYSHPESWPEILASGYLEPRRPRSAAWPRIVHLTDEIDRLPTGFGEGRDLLFTVDIDAEPWGPWGRTHLLPECWLPFGVPNEYPTPGRPRLSPQNRDADHWYVTTEPVNSPSWTEVRRLDENKVVWPTPGV
jgi:hypothetical protein